VNKIQISPPTEFSFELACSFLERSPRELLHRVEGGKIFKALSAGTKKILFTIQQIDSNLAIEFLNHQPSNSENEYAIQYVYDWLDLSTDLKPFYKKVEGDPLLGPLIQKYYGYRIVGQPDLFESLVWAVLGQQINLTFAYTLKQRFVEQFGEAIEYENKKYFLFPSSDRVSQLNPDTLLALQFSKQKANYTIGIAQAFASGEITKKSLQSLSLAEGKERLMKIKGIGNWTANYALMKTFRYPDAFPLEDVGIHNAIKNLKGMKTKPTLDQVKRIFKKYNGWEAYATLYLWKSL
jgi:DNA-3-methyladenine glycosylase II